MAVVTALHPDDILLALLVLGKGQETNKITGISRKIHRTVQELASEFPVLGSFVFTDTTVFPYSEQLASSLRDLQWTRLIGMENPDFRVFFVKSSADKVFNKAVRPKMSKDDEAQLMKASERFWRELAEE